MYKRILMSMMAFGLAAFLMGGATMAWFTSTDSTQSTIQSGTVEIAVTPDGSAATPVQWVGSYNNMAPGQTVMTDLLVTNTGSLPMKYRTYTTVSGDAANLANYLDIKVKQGANVLYSGELSGLDSAHAIRRFDNGVGLAANGTETLTFEVYLDTSAPNSVAGASLQLQFHFDATQPDNPGWDQ